MALRLFNIKRNMMVWYKGFWLGGYRFDTVALPMIP